MFSSVRRASTIALMAGALSLGGCATVESVQRAQDTADHAMSHAQAAETAAQRAQSTADSAESAARNAAADANKANTRLDSVESNLDHLMHHHEHATWRDVGVKHRHHRHHMPKTATPNPAPTNAK